VRAALDVADASLDLQLRYRQPPAIDRARFVLWTRRLGVAAATGDEAGVTGALATLEWIRDRFAHTLGTVARTRVDARLVDLRADVSEQDLRGAAAEAARRELETVLTAER
jgi:hypothetical protein